MKPKCPACLVITVAVVLALQEPLQAQKHKLVNAKDGSGVFGYKDTPIQPWSGFHVHDPDRPAPPKVEPGAPSTQTQTGTAPSDAIALGVAGETPIYVEEHVLKEVC